MITADMSPDFRPQCDFLQESAGEIRELQADANEEELAYLEEKLALRSRLRDYAEAHRLSFRFIASAQLFLAGAASTPLADDPAQGARRTPAPSLARRLRNLPRPRPRFHRRQRDAAPTRAGA